MPQTKLSGDSVRAYLRDIGRIPLLEHEEEILLGRKVQRLMELQEKKKVLEICDEELAEQRGYDQAFVVENPYKNKLEKIKKILKTNVEIWDETQHDPIEEFKLLLKIINESEE